MIKRKLQEVILSHLHKGKIVLLLGPRQAGKTTLVREIVKLAGLSTLWMNGDETDVRDLLSDTTSTRLKAIIGNHQLMVIDEAQRISNIGITLKLIVDNIQDVQVIATGSSALELANQITEPLTGRKYEYFLYPVSFVEMVNQTNILEEKRLLEHRLVYGYYPEVVTKQGEEQELLRMLSESYLYKDLFVWKDIKKPALLEKLLQALAFQLGNEVSFRELGEIVGVDNQTVERYVDLLEKAFVIFRLGSLSRNLRNEIKKSKKFYFYDNGIRNAIIRNFNPITLRQDKRALWENFLIAERLKVNHYNRRWVNCWFWRTHAQQEIDYIEEYAGQLYAYEFKWSPQKRVHFSKSFLKAYPESTIKVINIDTFMDFIM
ncbi:MAG: AAA family ATPase [Actinobacteria bacterium]|nr:AAA family ATPase [Actinomycetota bacterium]